MSDWKNYYKEHLVTMEEAASQIVSGDYLWLGNTIGVPYNFLNALNKRRDELENVGIIYNFSLNMHDMLFDEESKGHFRIMSVFTGPLDRMSGHMGISEFHSVPYEYLIRVASEIYPCNYMIVEVCPPDENGNCNTGILGAPTNCMMNKVSSIVKRIAVVNKHQSPAQGNYEEITIPVEHFDFIVEDDHELPFLPVSAPTPVDKTIADFVMEYVNDGDTIQIGMGGLGEQITKELYTKHDLTFYTEIAVDSMIPLVEQGNVKHLSAGGCFGSPELYHFLGTSDKVTIGNVATMIDPVVIGKQDNMVAINSTFMVDLLGQACSEAQGLKQYSSVGGSFGYLYGATRSKGGRSFLCLRSTYTDSQGMLRSNIVPWLPEGSVVTSPKYLQMYIVSEHGVADVFLKSNKDRIRALIKIAHPEFREDLKEKIISSGQITSEEFDS